MGSGARAAPAVWRKPRMKDVGRVRVDDVPTIAAIERRSFSDPWSERSFRDVLSHPQIYFACIRDLVDGGGGASAGLGYVVAWFPSGQGEIANLAVEPDLRGRGIGSALFDAALGGSRRHSPTGGFLAVRPSHFRAPPLDESRGF